MFETYEVYCEGCSVGNPGLRYYYGSFYRKDSSNQAESAIYGQSAGPLPDSSSISARGLMQLALITDNCRNESLI